MSRSKVQNDERTEGSILDPIRYILFYVILLLCSWTLSSCTYARFFRVNTSVYVITDSIFDRLLASYCNVVSFHQLATVKCITWRASVSWTVSLLVWIVFFILISSWLVNSASFFSLFNVCSTWCNVWCRCFAAWIMQMHRWMDR